MEGASVIINGRSEERVASAVQSLNSSTAKGFVGDLTKAEKREALFKAFPKVDILINNLGIFEAKALSEIGESDWEKMFHVNVVSGAVLSQHYLKEMLNQNWGRIIFISSESGVNIPPDMIHYGVSKASQMALSRGLSELTKGTQVTVNAVLPGPTLSEGVSTFLESVIQGSKSEKEKGQAEFIAKMRPTSLIQRFAKPEEVANLVGYLSSPLASATNGAAMRVEGGLLRNIG